MRPHSRDTVDNARIQLRHGRSTRQVSKALGISIGLVAKIREKDKENIPEAKVGRPTKISKGTSHLLAEKYLIGDLESIHDAQQYVLSVNEGPVHDNTIRNHLKAEGVNAFVKQKKPSLSPKNMAERYKFALDHLEWTVEDWSKVMFSDETVISRIGSFGRKYYYSNREHKLQHPHHYIETKKSGGGKIMLWGCITYNRPGDLHWIEGTMNSAFYVDVLRKSVIPSQDWCGLDRSSFIFQQDNASIHTAAIVKQYFVKSKITTMKWPANSPDLSPIERVWAYVKQQLYRYPTPPKNMQETFDRVEEIWKSLPVDYLHKLYEMMPELMKKLKKARGGNLHK